MGTQKLVVGMVWIAAACFGAEPKLKVVIFDRAGTPGGILQEAAETARQAFQAAGLETGWSVCRVSRDPNEHCILPSAGTYLEANVVPSSLGLTSDEPLGLALTPRGERSVVSWAFYGPAKELAARTGQSVAVVLAYVMAHEVGHLLGMKHRPFGIMQSKFERRDLRDAAQGRLSFTTEDAKALRAAVKVLNQLAQVPSQRD